MSPKTAVLVLSTITLFLLVLSTSAFVPNKVLADGNQVTGFIWSSTIGWIKLNHSQANSVTLTNNVFSGYGWSPNVGWVKFDSSLKGPTGTGVSARVDTSTTPNKIIGWARACSGMTAGSGISTDPNNTCGGAGRMDGFDGWIHFDHSQASYRPVADATGKLSGFGWGAEVLGWLSMAKVQLPFVDQPFNPTLAVSVQGPGSVGSNPDGISCPDTCSASYIKDTDVVLTASTVPDSWTGCDTVSANKLTCNVKMTVSKGVSVVFPAGPVCTNPAGCEPGGGNSISATCTVTPASPVLGNTINWKVVNPSGGSNYVYSWAGVVTGSGDNVSFTPTIPGSYSESVTVTSGTDSSGPISCPTAIVSNPGNPTGVAPTFTFTGISNGEIQIDCEHNANCSSEPNSILLTLLNKADSVSAHVDLSISGIDASLVENNSDALVANLPADLAPGQSISFRVQMNKRYQGTEKFGMLHINGYSASDPTQTKSKDYTVHYLDRTQAQQ